MGLLDIAKTVLFPGPTMLMKLFDMLKGAGKQQYGGMQQNNPNQFGNMLASTPHGGQAQRTLGRLEDAISLELKKQQLVLELQNLDRSMNSRDANRNLVCF